MKISALKLSVFTIVCLLGLSACDKHDSDDVSRRLDSAVDNAQSKMESTAENMSEKMDNTSEKAGAAVGDAATTTKIKAAFLAESTIKSMDINVDTVDGVVTLTGSTDTKESSQKAAEIAGAIENVKKVNNELAIK